MAERRRARIGFYFVAFPESIWDDDIHLTTGEFRLFGYIIRHTLVYGEDRVRLTDDELINGRKRADGTRKDRGCGIRGPNNLREAKERLEGKGWLVIELDRSAKPQPIKYYSINPALFCREDHVSVSDTSPPRDPVHVSEMDRSNVTVICPKQIDVYPKRTPHLSETDTSTKERARTEPLDRHASSSTTTTALPAKSDEEWELLALQFYNLVLSDLADYHRGTLARTAVADYRNAFEFHLRNRHPLTQETIRIAVGKACASWKAKNLAGCPISAEPVLNELRGLINPMPAGNKNANSNHSPSTNGAPRELRNAPRSSRPEKRAGNADSLAATRQRLAQKVERRNDPAGG